MAGKDCVEIFRKWTAEKRTYRYGEEKIGRSSGENRR